MGLSYSNSSLKPPMTVHVAHSLMMLNTVGGLSCPIIYYGVYQ